MASIGYSAPKDTEVSFVTSTGESKRVKFKDGAYTTSNEEEIAALDACAELKSHPISFAPKKER
jgi:uncharacterized protein with FMN-binding domain